MHLVIALGRQIFANIYKPRIGILGVIKTCDPAQVSTMVLFLYLKSYEVMKEFKEAKFKDHLAISSEYIKFLAHNLPFELVESLENKFETVEGDLKLHTKKIEWIVNI